MSEEVFQRASALRERLKEVESTLGYEEKRAAKRAIRYECVELLYGCCIPQPLLVLIGELLGVPIGVKSWPDGKMAAVLIEARQSKRIGVKRLATLLREETGKSVDPDQIKNWRRSPEYRYLVNVRREPKGG